MKERVSVGGSECRKMEKDPRAEGEPVVAYWWKWDLSALMSVEEASCLGLLCAMIHGGPDMDDVVKRSQVQILLAGNYCHDTIITGQSSAQTLGGSSAYVVNVLQALDIASLVVSKVGSDFAYHSRVSSHPPITVPAASTTHFVADYSGAQGERLLRADKVCQPILPSDFPQLQQRFGIGMAIGVAGEITAETLERMMKMCDRVIVDLQALIRVIDPVTGSVRCRRLEETEFEGMLHRVAVLKAARSEARYMDVESVRRRTCVIVTDGDKGSRVYEKSGEFHVAAFPAMEVDPTGAGDSFLGGLTAGLHRGLSMDKAVVLGNYFGALAVAQVGIPRLTQLHIQNSHNIFVGNGDIVDGCACTETADAGQQRHCLVCTRQ